METDDLKNILSRFKKIGEFPVGCIPVMEQNNDKSTEQGLQRGQDIHLQKKHKNLINTKGDVSVLHSIAPNALARLSQLKWKVEIQVKRTVLLH